MLGEKGQFLGKIGYPRWVRFTPESGGGNRDA